MMSEQIAKLKEWWSTLAEREKKAVALAGSVLVIALFYLLIWSPYLSRVASLRKHLTAQKQTLLWMKKADKEIERLGEPSQSNKAATTPIALLAYLQKEITAAGLEGSLSELKQADNEAVELQFGKVNFDRLMKLLLQVAKDQPVVISRMSVKADTAPGLVSARLSFKLSAG